MSSLIQLEYAPILKRLGRACLLVLGRFTAAILILILVGTIAESIAEVVDEHTIPLVGQMVDIGGYSLHISCVGTGSPTVVIDSGIGDWSTSWVGIQTEVARTTRVCIYDRAGYGWSEVGPQPRTSQQFVKELRILLNKADVQGPYLLVGHSLGGLTVRLFAHEYPAEVSGLVLVDARNPGSVPLELSGITTPDRSLYGIESILPVLARIGIIRLVVRPFGLIPHLMPEEERAKLAFLSRPVFYQTLQDEIRAIPESLAQASAVQTLGDLPVIVLSRALGNSAADKRWRVEQAGLLHLSTDSQQVIAEKSGHNIELDQPEVVIEAILKLMSKFR
jgi:pimeloyl-ACP methyl ester carboxylesterase